MPDHAVHGTGFAGLIGTFKDETLRFSSVCGTSLTLWLAGGKND